MTVNQRRAERPTQVAEISVQQGAETPKCRRNLEEMPKKCWRNVGWTAEKQRSRAGRRCSLHNTSVLVSVQV